MGGAPEPETPAVSLADGAELVRALMAEGLSRMDAARQAAAQTGLPKNDLYEASMQ